MLVLENGDVSDESDENFDQTKQVMKMDRPNIYGETGIFYPWECISIIRKDKVTLDF